MTTLIGISGRKQSGKTTLCNFLHGHELLRNDIIERFLISDTGDLVVNSLFYDDNGKEYEAMGILDLWQHNAPFYEYAARRIWPIIRGYSFADSLKEICVMLFNIPPECVYGTDEQKNQVQKHLLWENMPGVMTEGFQMSCVDWQHYSSHFSTFEPKSGPMTAREFMQFFGTEVMRKMYSPIWTQNCLNRILDDSPPIAVIADCRFKNEANAIKEKGGVVIRLDRNVFDDSHKSENDLDDYDGFDLVIDNNNMSIKECNDTFLEFLINKGITKPVRTIGKRTASIR